MDFAVPWVVVSAPIAPRLARNEAIPLGAKRSCVIRVTVPIDIGTVAQTACGAFALATPLRVDELLTVAVREALGMRAPQDKRDRVLRATLAGFEAGQFVVDIDGRIYDRPESVVLCAGAVRLRFFSSEPQQAPRKRH